MLTKRWGAGRLSLAATALSLILSGSPLNASSQTVIESGKTRGPEKGLPSKPAMDRTLTLESFAKLVKAETNLKGLVQRDPNLERALAMNGDENAFDSWRHRLDMKPAVTEAIKSAGMTTREYVGAIVSVMRASAVAGLKKQGKDVPAPLRQAVPAENITFVQSHQAEVETWWRGASGSLKPNTMEDLYVMPEDSTKLADKKPAKKPVSKAGTSKSDPETDEKTPDDPSGAP